MNDLISRKALIDSIQGTVSEVAKSAPYDPVWFTRLAQRQFEILNIIDDAPAVDAVEVVRCKDCRYAKDMLPLANAMAYQMGVCTVRKEDGIEFTVWEHDFCSYGERKDNE